MIKVSVLYPNAPGATFDMDYYVGKHLPLVQQASGATCNGVAVDQGLAGAGPDARATYIAMGHFLYDTIEAFQQVFAEHGQALLADIPNFTNVQPVIQISATRV